MNLIFVNRYFYPDHSATSQMLTDLAFALADRGQTIYVITSRQCYDEPRVTLVSSETVRDVHIHRVWTSRFGRAWLPGRAVDYLTFYASAAWRLWRLARAQDIIIAKTDPPLISVVAAWVSKLRGAELLNWLQDIFPEVAAALKVKIMRGKGGYYLQRLRNNSLKTARMNIALGERMAEYLRSQGISSKRITVIHNWADGQAIQPLGDEKNPLRAEWGLSGKFVVGYSGNLGRAHEFETILGAADELCHKESLFGDPAAESKKEAETGKSAIVFLFIGGGHQKTWLERETQRRGLNNVMFQPYQPREMLRQSLSVADVHLVSLLPALEGFIVPSKFYGIAAAARPTLFIGDPQGEIARIIKATECGTTVMPGDSKALARQILRLQASDELRASWGRNARAVFEKCYDKPVAMRAWFKVISGKNSIHRCKG